eukprot:4463753-Pleurochrysis_carterae.AAC.1
MMINSPGAPHGTEDSGDISLGARWRKVLVLGTTHGACAASDNARRRSERQRATADGAGAA